MKLNFKKKIFLYQVAERTNLIVTMLPNNDIVRSVYEVHKDIFYLDFAKPVFCTVGSDSRIPLKSSVAIDPLLAG